MAETVAVSPAKIRIRYEMNLRKLFFNCLAFGLLLSSCDRAIETPIDRKTPLVRPPSATLSPLPAETLVPSDDTVEAPYPPAITAARQSLADLLAIQPEEIAVTVYTIVDWSDACLELGSAEESCAQVITPGYRIILQTGGKSYIYHSDQNGTLLRQELAPANLPQAAIAARKALADKLGIESELLINVVSVEEVEWPDSCLGVSSPDVMCLQVIMPGYRVILESNGRRYEYHTDESGQQIVAVKIAPLP